MQAIGELKKLGQNDTVAAVVNAVAEVLFGSGEDGHLCEGKVLSVQHVEAIEEEKFLYSPVLAEKIAVLSTRLANVNRYVHVPEAIEAGTEARTDGQGNGDAAEEDDGEEGDVKPGEIEPRMAEALLQDLADLLELAQSFTDQVVDLRIQHDLRDQSIFREDGIEVDTSSTSTFRWLLSVVLRALLPKLYKTIKDDEPKSDCIPKVKLPAGLNEILRERRVANLFNGALSFLNEATDILVAIELFGLGRLDLFGVAVGALILTFIGRIVVGFLDVKHVDWENPTKSRWFVLGILLIGFEPKYALDKLIKPSLKKEIELPTNVAGVVKDSNDNVTGAARKDILSAQTNLVSSLLGLFIEDLPALTIQILYFVVVRTGDNLELDSVFAAAMATTVTHILGLLGDFISTYISIPGLRTMTESRNLVFESDKDTLATLTEQGSNMSVDDDAETNDPVPVGTPTTITIAEPVTNTQQRQPRLKDVVDAYFLQPMPEPHSRGLSGHSRAGFFNFQRRLREPALVPMGSFYHVVQQVQSDKASPLIKRTEPTPIRQGIVSRLLSPALNRMNNNPLHSIRSVEFNRCKSIDAVSIRLLVRRCPGLRSLRVAYCNGVNDEALEAMNDERCPSLEQIVLDHCAYITDLGICDLMACSRTTLTHLKLANLPMVTVRGVEHVVRNCGALHSLVLDFHVDPSGPKSSMPQIGDDGLASLGHRCGSTLREVYLDDLLNVSKAGLVSFFDSCNPYLEEIGLSGCTRVDDAALSSLSERCRFLTKVNLSRTKVTDSGVSVLARRCLNLQVVSLLGTSTTRGSLETLSMLCKRLSHVVFDNGMEQAKELFQQFSLQVQRVELHRISNYDTALLDDMKSSLEKLEAQLALKPAVITPVRMLSIVDQIVRMVDYVRRMHYRNCSKRLRNLLNGPGYTKEQLVLWDELYRTWDRDSMTRLLNAFNDFSKNLGQRQSRSYLEESLGVLTNLTSRVVSFSSEEPGSVPEGLGGSFHSRESLARPEGDATAIGIKASVSPEAARFPYPSLSPFGLLSTNQIDLRVQFDQGTYTVGIPSSIKPRYLSPGQVLQGNISPLFKVPKVSLKPIVTKKQFAAYANRQRFQMPRKTRFYCFAYPSAAVRSEFHFHERCTTEDIPLRLASFGGFLYFDEYKRFLSAAAISVGSTFCFNGPFPLEGTAEAKLDRQGRWQPVYRLGSNRDVGFAWIFPNELAGKSITQQNQHGGFIYKDAATHEGSSVFTLASLSDIVLDAKSRDLW